ncbi:hypothetical protein C0J52_14052 [Blattella germanica]|nr:hypothetical protein C0J52_14052 [Blattella germanica]
MPNSIYLINLLKKGFPVFRVQPARELPSVSRFVRRVDRRPVSEESSRRCCLLPEPSFRSFSFVVRGSHRSSGFHWTVGLRYFLIPLATGVMIFGTGYVKEEWRQAEEKKIFLCDRLRRPAVCAFSSL